MCWSEIFSTVSQILHSSNFKTIQGVYYTLLREKKNVIDKKIDINFVECRPVVFIIHWADDCEINRKITVINRPSRQTCRQTAGLTDESHEDNNRPIFLSLVHLGRPITWAEIIWPYILFLGLLVLQSLTSYTIWRKDNKIHILLKEHPL